MPCPKCGSNFLQREYGSGDVRCVICSYTQYDRPTPEAVLRAEAAERPGAARGPRIGQTKYTGISAEWIRHQYLENKLGYNAICKAWRAETGQSVGKDTIKKAILAAGITPRDGATATRLKWQQVKAERLAKRRVQSG